MQSITALMEEYSDSWQPGISTGHSKHSGLHPCSRERFPQCNSSALPGEGDLSKVVPARLGTRTLECSNSALLGEEQKYYRGERFSPAQLKC